MRILDEKQLRERRNRLLEAVILEFIRTAKPVSSAAVAEMENMKLSPATIRNMFHQLEEEGFLQHPHTSAGRVPTDRGYRYYVDYLVNLQEHLIREEERIRQEYEQRQRQMEEMLQQTSRMLAYLSHHAGFVLQPKLEESTLQRVELIHLGEGRVLMVLIASNGLVRYKIIESVPAGAAAQIKTLAKWVNAHFQGKNLNEFCLSFSDEMREKLEEEKSSQYEFLSLFSSPIENIARELREDGLLFEGASNVLKAPDVSTQPRYLQEIASAFEDREHLTQLLRKEVERGRSADKKEISILIGRESRNPLFEQLALVSKSFETEDKTVGFLGIIGPKRMEYGRMVALVENIQAALQKFLTKETLSKRGGHGGENA